MSLLLRYLTNQVPSYNIKVKELRYPLFEYLARKCVQKDEKVISNMI